MAAYYNEFDEGAANWLRELIKRGLIPFGYVDDRSILDVHPDDLIGFTSHHFFAGIGGWPLALRMAGWADDRPVWTGSPPCQPFSVAGKKLAQEDPRHLAPAWLRLTREHRPQRVFGEQVAAAIGKDWLDDLFAELEGEEYACGASVLPACSVGAPHKRERLFFGAACLVAYDGGLGSYGGRLSEECFGEDSGSQTSIRSSKEHGAAGLRATGDVAYSDGELFEWCRTPGPRGRIESSDGGSLVKLGYANDSGPQIWLRESGKLAGQERWETEERPRGLSGLSGELGNSDSERHDRLNTLLQRNEPGRVKEDLSEVTGAGEDLRANPPNGFWDGADWLGCRDGKFRPVRPGSFPLANGIPARVGRLRGYGNAIVPQVAAEFILAFEEATGDLHRYGRPDLDDLI